MQLNPNPNPNLLFGGTCINIFFRAKKIIDGSTAKQVAYDFGKIPQWCVDFTTRNEGSIATSKVTPDNIFAEVSCNIIIINFT